MPTTIAAAGAVKSFEGQPLDVRPVVSVEPDGTFEGALIGPFNYTAVSQTLLSVDCSYYNTVAFQITGAFVAAIAFEGTVDGTNWVSLIATPIGATGSGQSVGSVTAPGLWVVNVAGLKGFRLKTSSYTSGTAVATASLSKASVDRVATFIAGSTALQVYGNINVTSNGGSIAKIASTISANLTLVKATVTKLIGGYLKNRSATEVFFKFYNKATAPVAGDVPLFIISLSPGERVNLASLAEMYGVSFATGMGYAITGGIADADATFIAAANDVIGFILYA